MVNEGCTCFTQAEGMIRAVRMPLFLHAVRTLVRNVLVLAHNVVVHCRRLFVFPHLAGLDCAAVHCQELRCGSSMRLAICLLLGAFCARFRDIGPIVGSVMQIAFFLTPVIWQPEQLGRQPVDAAVQSVLRAARNCPRAVAGCRAVAHGLARRAALQRDPVHGVVVVLRARARARRFLDLIAVCWRRAHRHQRRLGILPAVPRQQPQPEEDRVGGGLRTAGQGHAVSASSWRPCATSRFTSNSGDRLGLIGMNGAGKTTLLRTLAGIYEPVMGHVRVKAA